MTVKRISNYWIIVILYLVFSGGDIKAQPLDWEWAKNISGTGNQEGIAIETDPVSGVIYLSGTWENDLSSQFPATAIPGNDFSSTYGKTDGFVAKYDSLGSIV